ncbi:MAG: hypothetical protein ACE5HA_01365 [Anaerolineae bacterium]
MRPCHAFPLSLIVTGTALGLGWMAVSTTVFPAFSPLSLSDIHNLSISENPSSGAVIAVVADAIHVVWVETIYGWPEIYHTYRIDTSHWSTPARLEAGTQPNLSVGPDDTVDLVWLDESTLGGGFNASFIRYRRWNSALHMWLDADNVAVGSLGTLESPAVAVGPDGESHVVWVDSIGGSSMLRYRRRSGSEWGSPQNIAFGREPDIGVDSDGRLHLVWSNASILGQTDDIYYRWKDAQGSWSLTYVLSDRPSVDSVEPAMAIDQAGMLYLGWREIAGVAEMIAYRSGRRSSWPSGSELVAPIMSRVGAPAITVDEQGSAYLAFAGQSGLQYRVLEPTTQSWAAGELVAGDQPDATSPQLVAGEDGLVNIVWAAPGVGGETDIFYRAVRLPLEPAGTPTTIATGTPTVSLTPAATTTATVSLTPAATAAATPNRTPSVTPTPIGGPTKTPTITPEPTRTTSPGPSSTPLPAHKGYVPLILRNPHNHKVNEHELGPFGSGRRGSHRAFTSARRLAFGVGLK